MIRVFAATATELTELQPIRRGLLILGRYVVAALALIALKHDVVAWHNSISNFPIADFRFDPIAGCLSNRQSQIGNRQFSIR
jgi:hypothetical protein